MDAYARWKENPPVKAEKADKKSVSSDETQKPKRKWSEEAKANAAAKRAAKKAAKEAESDESDAESDAESVAHPPKPVAKPVEKPAEKPVEKPVEKQKMAKVMKPKAAPAPPPPVAAVTAVPQEGEFWEHNFGSGVEKYERFPADLVNSYYVFHPKDGYMGLWDADMEELNPDVPDPTA
jgi:hypothetical protein